MRSDSLWSEIDLKSRTLIRDYFAKRISTLRAMNDSSKLNESETTVIRGAILECKRIISEITPPSVDGPRDDDEPNPFA
jgi:hypothetical protein